MARPPRRHSRRPQGLSGQAAPWSTGRPWLKASWKCVTPLRSGLAAISGQSPFKPPDPGEFLTGFSVKNTLDTDSAGPTICYIICKSLWDSRSYMAEARKIRMAKENKNAAAEMIRKLRAQLGLTQEQFAAKVGVTWSTVNRWENGRGMPSPLAMRQIELLQIENRAT